MSYATGTTVPVGKTRAEIENLVVKYGATRFASGWDENGAAAINFVANGRLVRFVLRLPTAEEGKKKASRRYSWQSPTAAQIQKWVDSETRRRWRCLLLVIKAKLEVVETGIETFEQAFLANIVTNGNMTIYERLRQAEGEGQRLLPPVEQ